MAFVRSYNFWKSAENSYFWIFFNPSVTASWISATSAKRSPFNFIFNLGNRKQSGGDKSGEYGGDKSCNIFWGQKLANICRFVGGCIIVQKEKILDRKTQLDEPVECASGGDPILLSKILHLLFSPLEQILCALRLESRKNYQHGLDAGPLEFQFLRLMGRLTNPFRTLSLCFGVTGKTPSLISRNNFVKTIFVCIGHRDNALARCDSIFPLLRCQGVWEKTRTQLTLSHILFQNPKNYSLGDVQRFCYHS